MKRRTEYTVYGSRPNHYFESHFSGERLDAIRQGKLYRSRNGMIMGVCRGVADFFDFRVFWIRLIALILLFSTGFWPTAVIYFIAGFIMKPEPVIPLENIEEKEFYDSYLRSREMAKERIKRRYERLERRIQRLEHAVTTPEFDWEKRFNSET